jgi:hypothetical protein
MSKILHIFKKDIRRHWPEILISLALLALYTRRELHLWQNSSDMFFSSPFSFLLSGSYIPFFLALSWVFLILRVVHSETLVGDRQWWVTKPYSFSSPNFSSSLSSSPCHYSMSNFCSYITLAFQRSPISAAFS